MRTSKHLPFPAAAARWLLAATLLLGATSAHADVAVYTASVSSISNTCATAIATPGNGPLTLTTSGENVTIAFGAVPEAKSKTSTSGKLRASAIAGATHFNYSGRITNGGGTLILVAETFAGDKPVCSQSWNLALAKS